MERISILEIFLKNQWYKAQVSLDELCLSVTFLDQCLLDPFDAITDEVRTVRITKSSDTNFGISIKGGKENDMPVFISKVFKDTPADVCGQLHTGDSILSVNGASLRDATHEDAVKALKQAGDVANLEVKYLREVMLQYKKASLLPEIGWDFSDTVSPPKDSVQAEAGFCLPQIAAACLSTSRKSKSDTMIVPLLLCHLTCNLNALQGYLACLQAGYERNTFDAEQLEYIGQDEGRAFVIYSPDLRNCVAFRCVDATQCFVWINAIQSAIQKANSNAVSEANLVLRDVLDSATIKHMGWLNERMDNEKLRSTFLVLTNKELLFYDFVPWSVHNWAFPVHSYPLIHSRLVQPTQPQSLHSLDKYNRMTNKMDYSINNENNLNSSNGHSNGHSLESNSNGLTIRFGTTLGVVVVQLYGESQKTLLQWANCIVHNANNAALAMREAVFECIYDGRECELTLDVEFGFIFTDKKNNEVFLKKEFFQLVHSSDDNARFVSLQFVDEKSTREVDMLVNPKPFIFTLHTFLFAKLSNLGLIQ